MGWLNTGKVFSEVNGARLFRHSKTKEVTCNLNKSLNLRIYRLSKSGADDTVTSLKVIIFNILFCKMNIGSVYI